MTAMAVVAAVLAFSVVAAAAAWARELMTARAVAVDPVSPTVHVLAASGLTCDDHR
jgi:hypothetical protein